MTGKGVADLPLVLVVAMANSIHTARWLRMARGHGLRLVLLPVEDTPLTAELADATPVRDAADLAALSDREIGLFDATSVEPATLDRIDRVLAYSAWRPSWLSQEARLSRPGHLMAAIERLRPQIVHSMEIQLAGYLCLATKQHLGPDFPPWMLSNWGSDLYLYRKVPSHRPRLAAIARLVDAYVAECQRDVAIFTRMGFAGISIPPIPVSGGMHLDGFPTIDELGLPSTRKEIVVKGYHGWSGRGLHALAALHLAAPALRDYAIRVMVASPEVAEMAAMLAEWDHLDIVCEPYERSHRTALMRLAGARMVIGVGISDGISTTLLEAMALGAFPIQSTTSCGGEWIVPGQTGALVSPHDVAGLAAAIRRAATDDDLVDGAARCNRHQVEQRWNARVNGTVIAGNYRTLIAAARRQAASPALARA